MGTGGYRDSFTLIKNAFLQTIENLSENYQGSSLTDIFITVDKESGEVLFFDDEENKIAEVVVFNWVNKENSLSNEKIISILKDITKQLEKEDMFSTLDIYKPFSVNYSDENFDVIEELLVINEDSIVELNDGLMEKLDRDFDDFLEKLMKE